MLESSTVWGYVKQWAVEVSWCPGPTPFEGMPWTSSWPFPALPSPVPLYVTNVTIYAWCSSTLHACVEAQNLIHRNLYTQRIRRSALTQADHVGLIDCTLNFDKWKANSSCYMEWDLNKLNVEQTSLERARSPSFDPGLVSGRLGQGR